MSNTSAESVDMNKQNGQVNVLSVAAGTASRKSKLLQLMFVIQIQQ